MNLARRFKPERVKRVKSKLGKLNYKMTTEEKLFLKETWQKEGHKFSLDFYRELLFVIVRGKILKFLKNRSTKIS